MSSAIAHPHEHEHEHMPPRGLARWLFTTNHKDLGTLYSLFGLLFFFVSGLFAMLIRLQLIHPGNHLLQPEVYNQVISLHALIMIFAALMPVAAGFANYLIPMMVGGSDMALPQVNNLGFWLLPPAAVLLVLPLILQFFGIGNGGIDTGWTIYAPLSVRSGPGVDFAILGIFVLFLSSLLGSINIIVTILNMRAPGMTLMKLPLFAWAWLVTGALIIVASPALATGAAMLLADRHFGTHFFDAAGGGDPVLWQHMFWFFGHPEVYILLLPSAELVGQILATFARKPVFGYRAQVYSYLAIGVLSCVVWAHHMFTSGMAVQAQVYYMFATMTISVPFTVLFVCWFGTIWRGALTFETPMLFALGFMALFAIGGLTGLTLSDPVADQQYHGSYYVVGHFHYTLFGGAVMGLLAGAYYYLPKMTGHMYSERAGRWHFWLTIIGANIVFTSMLLNGIHGAVRRTTDYALQFAGLNMSASIGAFILGAAQLFFIYNIILAWSGRGAPASDRVWEGAEGLEFTVPSPPPYHTFVERPVVA